MWDIKVVQGDVSPNGIAGEMVPTPSPASRSSARKGLPCEESTGCGLACAAVFGTRENP